MKAAFNALSRLVTQPLVRQTLSLLTGHGASKLLSFAAFVLIARWLGPEQYGGFTFAFTLGSLLIFIPSMGADPFYTREVSAGRADAQDLLGVNLALKGLGSVLFLGLYVGGLLLTTNDVSARSASWYVGPAFALLAITQTWRAALVTSAHPGQAGLLDAVQSALFLLFVVTVVPNSPTPGAAAGGFLLGQSAGVIVGFAAVWKTTGPPRVPGSTNQVLRTLKGTIPLALVWFLADLYMRIDAAMLFYLRGNLDTGLYGAPYRLVEGLYSVAMVLCFTALPRLSRAWADSTSSWRKEWTHALGFLTVLIGPPILVFATVPGVLIQKLYGSSYAPAMGILRILTPASLLLCVGAVVGIGLTSIGREHAQLKLTAIALLVNVLSNFILIPPLGGIGAALATLLAALVYVSIGAVILYRCSANRGASLTRRL